MATDTSCWMGEGMGDWILKVVVAWGQMGEGLGGRG